MCKVYGMSHLSGGTFYMEFTGPFLNYLMLSFKYLTPGFYPLSLHSLRSLIL